MCSLISRSLAIAQRHASFAEQRGSSSETGKCSMAPPVCMRQRLTSAAVVPSQRRCRCDLIHNIVQICAPKPRQRLRAAQKIRSEGFDLLSNNTRDLFTAAATVAANLTRLRRVVEYLGYHLFDAYKVFSIQALSQRTGVFHTEVSR